MDTIAKITLWGKEVEVVSWNAEKEYAVFEFIDSFIKEDIDIAPLWMPMEDLLRGERIFSFLALQGKIFKGLPGLIAYANALWYRAF